MNILNRIDFQYLQDLEYLLDRIKVKKDKLDAVRPLSQTLLHRLRHDLSLEWTYNSNAIEGNSLTLIETKVVIEEGMTIGGKSLREHFEAINHKAAIEYLNDLIKPNYQLRAIDLLNMHELVLRQIDDQNAGRIRAVGVRILGANFTPPSPHKVSDYVDQLIDYVNDNNDQLVAPVMAAIFHHQLVWIHPFTDGNGRTGRLAMNLYLQSKGYPPCIILKNDRKKYYEALNLANKGKYQKLTLMVLQGIERTLNMYMDIIPQEYKEYVPLSSIAEEESVPYGAEYLGLLARKGLINAHKEGRNWVSTKEDVLLYRKLTKN